MPVCPKCGKYHSKKHHRLHVKTCVGWKNPALEHYLSSKAQGSTGGYKAIQQQLKQQRLKEIYDEV